jgi:hypothetical protein
MTLITFWQRRHRRIGMNSDLGFGKDKVKGGFTASFRQCSSRDGFRLVGVAAGTIMITVPPRLALSAPFAIDAFAPEPFTFMPSLRRSLLSSAIVLSLLGIAVPAMAQGRGDDRPQGQSTQDRHDPRTHSHDRDLAEAVRRIEREQRGQVLSAERVQYEGREVSRIKVIDDRGRVRVYTDDPHDPGANQPPSDER